ncbi:MAG TPA: M23 family metallopeptidase [Candidatus Paceibacterota bacterium]|nr:M23 family metallopeptidase [Candidatus Paceibacterota bacterium]
MVSLKTKNKRKFRLFLIVLIPMLGSTLAVSAYSLISNSNGTSIVKDESVALQNISEEEHSEDVVEPLALQDDKPVITTYTVVKGDTLSGIASKFSISVNTLLWANDLNKKSAIKEGQKLTILPVSGIVYTVKKGDTLGGIANKFDASLDEIISFNDLEENKTIKAGMKLILPNAELPLEKAPAPVAKKVETKPVAQKVSETKEETPETKSEETKVSQVQEVSSSYFTHPIPGSRLTQGLHGYNSVDFGAPVGTPVLASASGKVIVAKPQGYNGGYGHYVVIEHDNGTQTLYAHLSSVNVSVGDEVTKGEKIALSGNTGRSTGPHLHFEVRGGTNPWVGMKKLTQF